MQSESPGHTLQATALVNEAFLRLAALKMSFEDRAHFLAMASRTMRRILVDLDRALERLEKHDERLAESVELVFFGGLSYAEAAAVQEVSKTTYFENLRFAKARLQIQMTDPAEDDSELNSS